MIYLEFTKVLLNLAVVNFDGLEAITPCIFDAYSLKIII